MWEAGGPNPSPSYSTRGSLYGVGGVPHAQFQGTLDVVGGFPSQPMNYQPQYNSFINVDSPLSMELSMTVSGNDLVLEADVEVTDAITTTNNRVVFVITHNFSETWFSTVVAYDQTTNFDLTSVGQTETYQYSTMMDPDWELVNLKGVALVQSWGNNYEILQGGSTEFSGLLPMFGSNVTEGPASLGVQFTSSSFPTSGIDSWEWDFDGDGTYDSTLENPYYLYTEVGSYDVTLRISDDGEFAETTVEDYITVTDGSNITGKLSGIWDAAHNPFLISEDVFIEEGDQLLINPGVEINFAEESQFTIEGLLQANGSLDDPIVFTSNSEWKGLNFYDTQDDNQVHYCNISKANVSAILIENDSHVSIVGNKFFENTSGSHGAALDISSSDEVIINQNIIANNSSSSLTGGIALLDAIPIITNNIIVNNTGTYGAFSIKTGSDVILENNTIANNESTNGTPYLFFIFNSFITINNNIIQDNGTIFFAPYGDPAITYTCITGGFTGEGNIDADPLFMQPTQGDGIDYDGLSAQWWLQDDSPCIDAGNPDPIYNDPDGTRNDMGAYGGPDALEPQVNTNDEIVKSVTESSLMIYPNPFNPQTNIVLDISKADQQLPLSVKIYNLKGQLVKTLIDDKPLQHSHFIWNGKDDANRSVSSGIYFIKLDTNSISSVNKLMLLK